MSAAGAKPGADRVGEHFDLIITTLHIEDMHSSASHARCGNGVETPIVLLAYDNKERKELVTHYDTSVFEKFSSGRVITGC